MQHNNVRLRAPEPEDLDLLFGIENDVSLWSLSNTLTPFSRFDLEQFILLSEKDIFTVKQTRFIIEVSDKEQFAVGAIDLYDFDPVNKRAGVGVVILEKFRHQGYAGIALDILVNYAFEKLGLHQLFCAIDEDNSISLKLFKAHKFVECGIKLEWNRRDNKWINEYTLQRIIKEY